MDWKFCRHGIFRRKKFADSQTFARFENYFNAPVGRDQLLPGRIELLVQEVDAP